jgi:Domain of unknown function (DUF4105)
LKARERFHEYLRSLNQIHDRPRWYNAITTNCTTTIRDQHPAAERMPWDWRILLNGKGDELMFERHTIATASLPFAELNSAPSSTRSRKSQTMRPISPAASAKTARAFRKSSTTAAHIVVDEEAIATCFLESAVNQIVI